MEAYGWCSAHSGAVLDGRHYLCLEHRWLRTPAWGVMSRVPFTRLRRNPPAFGAVQLLVLDLFRAGAADAELDSDALRYEASRWGGPGPAEEIRRIAKLYARAMEALGGDLGWLRRNRRTGRP